MSNDLPIVLAVVDDDLVSEFLVTAVNQLGYAAVARMDVESAIEVVEKTPSLRVLISDVYLGGGTGPDLVRRALRRRPDLKVVFMTGGFQNVSFRRTDPLLSKPFALQSLRDALESVLSPQRPSFAESPMVGDRRRVALG